MAPLGGPPVAPGRGLLRGHHRSARARGSGAVPAAGRTADRGHALPAVRRPAGGPGACPVRRVHRGAPGNRRARRRPSRPLRRHRQARPGALPRGDRRRPAHELRPVRAPRRPAGLRAQAGGGRRPALPSPRSWTPRLMPLVLVLGGVRSGKSEVAERIAAAAGEPVCYLATGAGSDPEMAERIERHGARRPAGWRTVESDHPGRARVAPHETLLVDGIAPWLARRMGEESLWTEEAVAPLGREGRAAYQRALESVRAFAREAAERPGLTVVVAEESGLGLVPAGAGLRRYLDLAGEATQALASLARQAVLVVAGQPIDLFGSPAPDPPAPLDRVGCYPDERAAVAALAARHGRRPDELLATNGSAEAFWLLASVLRPRRAVVGNPNNPTGTLDPAAVVTRLARPGRVLVVDEAFMELVPGEPETLAGRAEPGHPPGGADGPVAREVPGLVVVRSLTKLWSLAGVRAGYLLAPPGIIATARSIRQPWSVNGLACAALTAWAHRTAVSGGAEAAAIGARVAAARAELSASLAAIPGVRVWPSAANFLLLRVTDGEAARAGLAGRGIAVRRADTFPGLTGQYLRVAVRCPDDNRRLVEALHGVLERLAPVGGR